MAATQFAVLQRQQGSSVLTAWPQVTPNGVASQNLDLIQICRQGESGSDTPGMLVNVDHTGAVHFPAVNPTPGTRVGVFYTRLSSTNSLAQIFADTFSNPSQLDILQVINNGGNISYYLNYQGVATGS